MKKRVFLLKLKLIFCLFFVFLFLAAGASFAQTQENQPVYTPPPNLHYYTQNVMLDVASALSCQLAGIDLANPKEGKCLGIDPSTGKIGFVPSGSQGAGAIGVMSGLIAMTFTPPIHTSEYFADLFQNFGGAKRAYAAPLDQGIGFSGLSGLLELWKRFRDLVYLLFVLVFVIIGLGIMFRVKIDPRTVMTIQNQIPKIIVGLVLVTFSFAIAGLVVDLMWVVSYLLVGIIDNSANATNYLQSGSPYDLASKTVGITDIVSHTTGPIGNILGSLLDNPFGKFIIGLMSAIIGKFAGNIAGGIVSGIIKVIGAAIGTAVAPGLGTIAGFGLGEVIGGFLGTVVGVAEAKEIAGFIIGGIAFLILLVALLFGLFRLWLALIKAYIFFLIDVVLGPLWILAGMVPGAQTFGFGAWLRDMLGNLSAFPTTLAMFLLGKVFIEQIKNASANFFIPPFVGVDIQNVFPSLVGLGIILMTPEVVKITRDMFKSPELKYGTAIGQTLGTGYGVVAGVTGEVKGALFRRNQAGQAVGPLAQWLDTRVRTRWIRGILGWSQENIEEIRQRAMREEQLREALLSQRTPQGQGTTAGQGGTSGQQQAGGQQQSGGQGQQT